MARSWTHYAFHSNKPSSISVAVVDEVENLQRLRMDGLREFQPPWDLEAVHAPHRTV